MDGAARPRATLERLRGYDRPPEVANADVGGVGDWELAGVGGVGEWELAGA